MREVTQNDPRQATLNQIANTVEFARFGDVGTVASFIARLGGVGVSITNTREGCGLSTTLDVKVHRNSGTVEKFFRDSAQAETWLNNELALEPVAVAPAVENAEDTYGDRGHTYSPIGGYRNPELAKPAPKREAARC